MRNASAFVVAVGPPTSEEHKRAVDEEAERSGRPRDECWVTVVHFNVSRFSQPEAPGQPSLLERQLSAFLGELISVETPQLSYILLGEDQFPAIEFRFDGIRRRADNAALPDDKLGDAAERVGAALGDLFLAKWVRGLFLPGS